MPDLSVVIPIRNEAPNILRLYQELTYKPLDRAG